MKLALLHAQRAVATLTGTMLVSDSLEYIQEVAGCRTVPVEVGSRYTDEEWSQRLMTVGDFISKHVVSEVCTALPGVQWWGERPWAVAAAAGQSGRAGRRWLHQGSSFQAALSWGF